ncbi:MAG: hypothetical protein ACTIKT_12145 [Microbacterium sp.]
MTVATIVMDEQLDEMSTVIAQFREHAHQVMHARHTGDVDGIHEGLDAISALYEATDHGVLAAALLERMFASDWGACQDSLTLLHLLP